MLTIEKQISLINLEKKVISSLNMGEYRNSLKESNLATLRMHLASLKREIAELVDEEQTRRYCFYLNVLMEEIQNKMTFSSENSSLLSSWGMRFKRLGVKVID